MAIVVTLGAICLAHWGLLYRGMFIVTAAWDNNLKTCVITATNPSLLKITFCISVPLSSGHFMKFYSSDGLRLRNLMFHVGGFDIETLLGSKNGENLRLFRGQAGAGAETTWLRRGGTTFELIFVSIPKVIVITILR
jgi:hypothetical protein